MEKDKSGKSPDGHRANRENLGEIGKVPKRTKKEGQVQIGKPPNRARRNRIRSDAASLLTVGSFLLTVELFYLQLTIVALLLTIGAFLLTVLASLLTVGAFLAYSGKLRLTRALKDCKQRSLTVSKKAPTVSKAFLKR